MVETYEYTLTREIEIADGGSGGSGQLIPVDTIILIAPSAKNSRSATALQRLVNRSLSGKSSDKQMSDEEQKKAKEENEKNKDKPIRERFPARDVINILASSDLPENTLEEAKCLLFSLLSDGCAEMNGKPVKKGDLEKMSFHDTQVILGEFFSNFLSNFLFE